MPSPQVLFGMLLAVSLASLALFIMAVRTRGAALVPAVAPRSRECRVPGRPARHRCNRGRQATICIGTHRYHFFA
ncbi:hypothetical protein LP419_15025 [Massilia sp. H-1]|nr:hypothetical protein LP419_15025 [Massilia sp. H-1]